MTSDDERLAFTAGTAFLLARAGAAARSQWSAMLGERRMTPHQHAILMALDEWGPTGQQRLGVLIGVDARNVVPIVDGLGEAGLVERTVDPADRRRRVVALTADGRTAAADLAETGRRLEQAFLSPLAPAEQQELHRMLAALLDTD